MNAPISSAPKEDHHSDTLARADLGERIYRAGLAWRRAVSNALEVIPLTANQYFLLRSLAELQEREPHKAFSNQEIAENAGVDEQTTYRAMKVLWSRGLICRDADNRQWLNLSTDAGLELLSRAKPRVEQASTAFFERIVGDLVPFFEEIAPLIPAKRWIPKRTRRVAPGSVW